MSERKLCRSGLTITEGLRVLMSDVAEEDRAYALGDIVEQIKARSGDEVQAGARLQYVRRFLKQLGAPPELIAIARDADITRKFNEFQISKFREKAGIARTIPDKFARERVIDRLAACDLDRAPTLQNIADIILAGSLRPSELATIRITIKDGEPARATGYSKGRNANESRVFLSIIPADRYRELIAWVRRHTPNFPGMTRSLRRWLQKEHGILTKDLRAIGSQYISDHYARNHAQRAIIQRLALRHKPEVVANEHYGTFAAPALAAH